MKTDGAGLCFVGFLNLVDTHEEDTPVAQSDANKGGVPRRRDLHLETSL
jgi:hypothetical protein